MTCEEDRLKYEPGYEHPERPDDVFQEDLEWYNRPEPEPKYQERPEPEAESDSDGSARLGLIIGLITFLFAAPWCVEKCGTFFGYVLAAIGSLIFRYIVAALFPVVLIVALVWWLVASSC